MDAEKLMRMAGANDPETALQRESQGSSSERIARSSGADVRSIKMVLNSDSFPQTEAELVQIEQDCWRRGLIRRAEGSVVSALTS